MDSYPSFEEDGQMIIQKYFDQQRFVSRDEFGTVNKTTDFLLNCFYTYKYPTDHPPDLLKYAFLY